MSCPARRIFLFSKLGVPGLPPIGFQDGVAGTKDEERLRTRVAESERRSVGSDAGVRHFSGLRAASGTVGRQTSVANLVKQGSITDVQSAGSLLAVPVMMLKHLQDDLALQFVDRLASDFLQGNGSVDINIGAEEIRLMRPQIAGDSLFRAQDDIALDQIFQLADIARPMILAQRVQQVDRKRLGARVEFPVINFEEVVD